MLVEGCRNDDTFRAATCIAARLNRSLASNAAPAHSAATCRELRRQLLAILPVPALLIPLGTLRLPLLAGHLAIQYLTITLCSVSFQEQHKHQAGTHPPIACPAVAAAAAAVAMAACCLRRSSLHPPPPPSSPP